MKTEEILQLVEDTRDEFLREEDRALLQHDLHAAEMALAGKYACDRIAQRIAARAGLRLPIRIDRGRQK